MDKNTLIGFVLIGALLFGFSWYTTSESLQTTAVPAESNATEMVAPTESPKPATATLLADDSLALASRPLYLQPRTAESVKLSNARVAITLSSRGAMPTEAVLADYLNQEKEPVRLFSEVDTELNLPIRTKDNELLNTRDLTFDIIARTDSSVTMRLPVEEGSYLDFVYTLRADDYRLGLHISGQRLERLLPANMSLQDLEWTLRMPQQEQSHRFETQYSGLYYLTRGGDNDDMSVGSDDEHLSETLRWIAFKDKYFSSALIHHGADLTDTKLSLQGEDEHSGYIAKGKVTTTFPFSLRDGGVADFTFFFGPNDYELLSSYDNGLAKADRLQLEHLVYLGNSVFRWINLYLIIPVVTFLKGFLSNWGIIILLLTIFIKILLSPFTFKSLKSQAKMRVLKPQVDAIAAKYEGKTDQESMLKKQQETMGLYSAAGASPLSGCLPMLLQMPFLIALYMYFPTSIFLRGESFLWAEDLSTYDPIIRWDFNIPLISSLLGNHISLFCLLMTIVNIVYNKYMMAQSSGGSEAMPGMKYMPYMMSVMFFFMFNQNASGLSYYYFISTLITILQYFAFRYTLDEEKLLARMEENKKKPRKKSKWVERLEEMQRQQREQQRQSQRRR